MTGFYVAVAVNVPLTLLVLLMYRRAVTKAMRMSGGAVGVPVAAEPHASQAAGTGGPLRIEMLDAGDLQHSGSLWAAPAARAARVVTVTSGLAFVFVTAAGWHLTVGGEPYPLWLLWWLVVLAWPIPLASGIVAGATGSDWLRLGAAYLFVTSALSLVCLAAFHDLTVDQILSNAATILLVALPVGALMYRRVRAVGLLVFAFALVVSVLAPMIAFALLRGLVVLVSPDSPLRALVGLFLVLIGPEATVALVVLGGMGAAAILGWQALRWIGSLYRRKRTSAQSLLLDAMWAVVAISHLVALSTQSGGPGEKWAWFLSPMLAYAIYWLVQRLGLRMIVRQQQVRVGTPRLLLLLRVFALGTWSERLFDVVSSQWLRAGPIAFIAGPDLASGTVQPTQFLEYVSGRLKRHFVATAAAADRQVACLDIASDVDGLYRASQFYCFADTWQRVVCALAYRAHVVLMDLRHFSPENQGCVYELEQLLVNVPLARIVLVVDPNTDWSFLERTLHRLWRSRRSGEGSTAATRSALRVIQLNGSSPREMRLVARLLAA